MGPHTSGGSIIDADLQRNSPEYSQGQGNDQIAELFPTVNLHCVVTVRCFGICCVNFSSRCCWQGSDKSFRVVVCIIKIPFDVVVVKIGNVAVDSKTNLLASSITASWRNEVWRSAARFPTEFVTKLDASVSH